MSPKTCTQMFTAAFSATRVTVRWGWTNTQTFLGLPDIGSEVAFIPETQSVTMGDI